MKVFWIFLCLPLINGESVSLSEVGKQVRSKRYAETSFTPTNSENFDNYEDYEENSSDDKNEKADKSHALTRKENTFMRSYLASLPDNPQYSNHRLIEPVQPPRGYSDRRGEQVPGFKRNPFEPHRDQGRRHRYKRHGSRGRGHGRGGRKRYRNNIGRVWTSELRMPDGKKVNITDPPYSKRWICPDTATMIQLKPDEIEYGIVKHLVKSQTLSLDTEISIQKIEKITNQCLWKKYHYQKTQISYDLGQNDVTETLLFNSYAGSPSDLIAITNEGLDERDLTMQSNEFGAAFEFTTTLHNGFRNGLVVLFRVALGNVQNVTSTTRLAHAPVGFHSVNKDNLCAIYRGDQVYPEFLIRYSYQGTTSLPRKVHAWFNH